MTALGAKAGSCHRPVFLQIDTDRDSACVGNPSSPFLADPGPTNGGFSFYFESGLQTMLTCTQGLPSLTSAGACTHFISIKRLLCAWHGRGFLDGGMGG